MFSGKLSKRAMSRRGFNPAESAKTAGADIKDSD